VSDAPAVWPTRSNNARRSAGRSVQFAGIGASRQRSVPLSKVSQPRRYSLVRPITFAGMVSHTIHRLPAWSSNSRSDMRQRNCTGQTSVAEPGSDRSDRKDDRPTGRSVGAVAARRDWPIPGFDRGEATWGWLSLVRGDGLLADVPVVALAATDAVSPAAHFGDLGNVPQRRPDGADGSDGFVERPRTPAVEQPAAGGGLDRPLGLAKCFRWTVRWAAFLGALLSRIGPGVHSAGAVGLEPKYWSAALAAVKYDTALGITTAWGLEA
jgi:hypothetical protein